METSERRCSKAVVWDSFPWLSFLLVSKIDFGFHCCAISTYDTCLLFSLCAQGMEKFFNCSDLRFKSVMDGKEEVSYRL